MEQNQSSNAVALLEDRVEDTRNNRNLEFFIGSKDSIMLYPNKVEVYVKDESGLKRVHLPPIPFNILEYLIGNAGRSVSKEEIYRNIWRDNTNYWTSAKDDMVRQQIRELRKKLGAYAEYIHTVEGFGYKYSGHNEATTNHNEDSSNSITQFSFGNITVDTVRREVHKDGKRVGLGRIEYLTLKTLAEARGSVVSDEVLFISTYHPKVILDRNLVRSRVRNSITPLRQKIEDNSSNPQYILNVWGVGYRLAMPENI
ncbi:MAG: winged helix-turn-helix domain-containing protein [Nanoarchaeota archaeon]